jgi:AcrR family transcriptional regulator/DNA-binding MarR family transcriptional regulator
MARVADGARAVQAPNGAREPARERIREVQSARILAAMVDECAARGAANVAVAHVVERARISRRTFYEIFANREACFLAAFDDALARVPRYALDENDPRAPWEARVRAALSRLLAFLDADRAVAHLLVVGSLAAGPSALDRRHHALKHVVPFVDEGRTRTKAGPGLPPLTAEGVVGGVLSVVHGRLLDGTARPLMELINPLMGMIVLPYLGSAAARKELARPVPNRPRPGADVGRDPLGTLGIRLTYRTVRVLAAVASQPGGSNRQVADSSGIADQGQVSKLLARLRGFGLVENQSSAAMRGGPNSWVLTEQGRRVKQAVTPTTAGFSDA